MSGVLRFVSTLALLATARLATAGMQVPPTGVDPAAAPGAIVAPSVAGVPSSGVPVSGVPVSGVPVSADPRSAEGVEQQHAAPRDEASGTTAADGRALPAILERVPDELPRATAGAWAALLGPDGLRPESVAALDGAVRAGLAAADEAYRSGDYPAALAGAFDVLERAPDLPPALALLGTTYFRLQRYGDTATCFERFLEVAPGELWRTQALGHAYYSLGRFEAARAHYERVVATGRAGVDALRGLGLAHLELGDEDAGIALLERVLERAPDHPEAHEALARVRFERGESDLALPLAERARDLAPFTPRPWFLLAQIYADLGREDDACGAETRWREVDRVVQTLRRLEAEQELAPHDSGLARGIVAARFELGDANGASRAALRVLKRATAGSAELLALATDTADALAKLGAFEASDRWADRIAAAFGDERTAWEWATTYWGARRDRVRQLAARRKLEELDAGR